MSPDRGAAADPGPGRVRVLRAVPALHDDHRPVRRPGAAAGGQLDGELPAAGRAAVHPARLHRQPRGHRRPALRLRAGAARPGARQPRLRQRRREPRVLVDERLRGRRRRRARQGRDPGDAAGRLLAPVRARRRRLVLADRAGHAAEHPGRHLRRPRRRLDRGAVRRLRRPGAADGDRAVRRGLPLGPPDAEPRGPSSAGAGSGRYRPSGDRPAGRPGDHPRRHPRRVRHAHRGRRGRRALHAAARVRLPHPAPARPAQGARRGRPDHRQHHADRRLGQPARLRLRPRADPPGHLRSGCSA